MPKQGSASTTILTLMDGSLSARAAAAVAVQFARSQSLSIRGLYVVDEALVLGTYTNYHKELTRTDVPQSRAELVSWFQVQGEIALDWLLAYCHDAHVPVATDLMFGGMPDLVLRRENGAALIALGRQGRGHAGNATLGHNFRAIAHHLHIPLLASGRRPRHVQRILLVYEPGAHSLTGLNWSIRLQRKLPATVTVLAFSNNGTDPAKMKTELAENGLTDFRYALGNEHTAANILDTALECRADLIVMSGYQHNALVTKFLGSFLEQVLDKTALPVLVT